jgi:FlaG/FlaF family flagellin (archaellin)
MMMAITLLLASVVAAGVLGLGDTTAETGERFDDIVEGGSETVSGNPWIGDEGNLIQLSNNEAGATDVRYRINFTIESGSDTIGNSLNSVNLEVQTGSPDMFSDTKQGKLDHVRIDTDGDGEAERDITGDVDGWEVKDGGTELKIGFSGSAYTPDAGDSIVVVFDGVDNPDTSGTYDLRAQTSGDGNYHYGEITIV